MSDTPDTPRCAECDCAEGGADCNWIVSGTGHTPDTSPEAVERMPREIWVDPDQKFDCGSVSARAAQDEYHDHCYVDKDIYDSAERYWKARAEAAEAEDEVARLREEVRKEKEENRWAYINAALEDRADLPPTLAAALQVPEVKALVGLLAEARSELAGYVEHDYPEATRAQYPSVHKRWERDMDLCHRIDAALEKAMGG